MAILKKVGELSNRLLVKNKTVVCITRNFTEDDYYKVRDDLKPAEVIRSLPGSYPKTEEERRKAAEKYGMHPREYKPLPDDEMGAGDYPDLPELSVEAKDPYYPWDFPNLRRNFEEPLHTEFDNMQEDRFPVGVRQPYNYYKCSLFLVSLVSGLMLLHIVGPEMNKYVMAKEFPKGGEHYTFEPLQ